MQIPQITRDKLASSAVGTPELDTSGQKIGQSMAAMGEQVGQAAGEYAIQRQNLLDQAESNRLIVSKNMADIQAFEQAKNTFASEPEKALPYVQDQMDKNLTSVQQQASNPRVSLMIGANNSYFPSKLGLDVLQWGQLQRVAVDKAHVINQGDQLIKQTTDTIDGKKSLQDNLNTFTLQSANVGHLIAGAYAAANPASAAEMGIKMPISLATNSVNKLMQSNASQAVDFLNTPNIKQLFASDTKQWDTLNSQATQYAEQQKKENLVDTRVKVFHLLKDNGAAFSTTNIIGWTAGHDLDLATALQKVSDRDVKYTPDDTAQLEQQNMLSKLIKQGNGKDVSDTILNYLKTSGDKLKPNELASLMQLGIDLHGNVPKTATSTFNQDSNKSDHVSGVKSLVDIGDRTGENSFPMVARYQKYTEAGLNPTAAASQALKDQQAIKNPGIALQDKPASVIVSKGETQRYFIGRENDMTKFPFIYDSGTKSIIPNKEYKIKRE